MTEIASTSAFRFMTHEVVREIEDQDFADSPTGLPGNDDLGEMSSWYVWSALGAYPENPGSSEVVLGARSSMTSSSTSAMAGHSLSMPAPLPTTRVVVRSLTVNGKSWTRTLPPFKLLHQGRDIGLVTRHLTQHHVGRCG